MIDIYLFITYILTMHKHTVVLIFQLVIEQGGQRLNIKDLKACTQG